MTGHLTVESRHPFVLTAVEDFARGLGCTIEAPREGAAAAVRITLPESSDHVLELMTHVALSATRAGADLDEPVCRVSFQPGSAASVVTLGLRIAEFDIDAASRAGL